MYLKDSPNIKELQGRIQIYRQKRDDDVEKIRISTNANFLRGCTRLLYTSPVCTSSPGVVYQILRQWGSITQSGDGASYIYS
jgi:hypothetical protein